MVGPSDLGFGEDEYKAYELQRRRQVDLAEFKNRFRYAADKFHSWDYRLDAKVAALTRADDHCEKCGRFCPEKFHNSLDIHHLEQTHGHEIPEDIVAICRPCHPRGEFCWGWTATRFRRYFQAEREAGIRRYIDRATAIGIAETNGVELKDIQEQWRDFGLDYWPLRYLRMKLELRLEPWVSLLKNKGVDLDQRDLKDQL